MTLNPQTPISWYAAHTTNARSECLATVYEAWGSPATIGGPYPTARSATPADLQGGTAPAGYPIWFETPEGDVVTSAGGGLCWATDQGAWGHIGKVTVAERLATLKGAHGPTVRLLGWSKTFLGQTIGAAPAAGSPAPLLRQGATGAPVGELQQRLNAHGAHLAVDGIFGPATAAAVRSFQTSQRLAVDGIVGPQTWAKLG